MNFQGLISGPTLEYNHTDQGRRNILKPFFPKGLGGHVNRQENVMVRGMTVCGYEVVVYHAAGEKAPAQVAKGAGKCLFVHVTAPEYNEKELKKRLRELIKGKALVKVKNSSRN